MSEHKSFVLSDWTVVEDNCSMRYIRHTDPNDIRNRVAFIEKTPRIRVGAYRDSPFIDSINWMYGDKSYYGDPASQVWCDDQLHLLGWPVYGEMDILHRLKWCYEWFTLASHRAVIRFSDDDVIRGVRRACLPSWAALAGAFAMTTRYEEGNIFILRTWSGAIQHKFLCQIKNHEPVFWIAGRNHAWFIRLDSDGIKDVSMDAETREYLCREMLLMRYQNQTYVHPELDTTRVDEYRAVVSGIAKTGTDLDAFLQQAK